MSDRGMKKWAPYKSLKEQWSVLDEQKRHLNEVNKPTISLEEAENINNILVSYYGQPLKISYYRYKKINHLEGTIKKIDPYNQVIILTNDTKIYLKEIIGLVEI